jgi:hypothetical protein
VCVRSGVGLGERVVPSVPRAAPRDGGVEVRPTARGSASRRQREPSRVRLLASSTGVPGEATHTLSKRETERGRGSGAAARRGGHTSAGRAARQKKTYRPFGGCRDASPPLASAPLVRGPQPSLTCDTTHRSHLAGASRLSDGPLNRLREPHRKPHSKALVFVFWRRSLFTLSRARPPPNQPFPRASIPGPRDSGRQRSQLAPRAAALARGVAEKPRAPEEQQKSGRPTSPSSNRQRPKRPRARPRPRKPISCTPPLQAPRPRAPPRAHSAPAAHASRPLRRPGRPRRPAPRHGP